MENLNLQKLFSNMSLNRSFASDNNAGIHPKVLAAIAEANQGHVLAYGHDPYTKIAEELFAKHFGNDSRVYFVYSGTGANCLALASLTHSYQAVLCADTAHIYEDETGAPEKITGCRLFPVTARNGKIGVEDLEPYLALKGVEHKSQPKVISITQTTEYGTLYSIHEIRKLAEFAHKNDMYLHMDGARIFNAAAALGVSFAAFTKEAGVDVLSFGGTKIGLMCGEAVVFCNPQLGQDFKFLRKHGLQLSSKMRFISAQFAALLVDDLGLKNALHANAMASRLASAVSEIRGVSITQPVEANVVFAKLPRAAIEKMRNFYTFHDWDAPQNEVRWMTSFDTTIADVDRFIKRLQEIMVVSP